MGLLGYNTISLTDLTDALPASLTLSSTLNSNTQIREGEKYIPDFTEEEIIITPSLFLGGTEIDYSRYNKQVFYQCGEQDENGEITYSYSGTELISNDIYVDRYGRLHYKKNLSSNITIEAFIKDFQDSGITYTTINVVNPITILFLTKDGGYSIFISSNDGREHFEEGQESPITLTAFLYNGIDEITGATYKWFASSKKDSLGNLVEITTDANITVSSDKKSITVARAAVNSLETFICEITNSYGTVFKATKNLIDKTDVYFGSIVSNGSLILTPEHTSVVLTSNVWYKTELINEIDSSRFSYDWYCIDENGSFTDITMGEEKNFTIDITGSTFPKSNFVVYCETKIDNKAIVIASIDIQYSPISYQSFLSPNVSFIPVKSDGSFKGAAVFSKVFSFKLIDDNKQPLIFNSSSDSGPTFSTISPFSANIVQNDTTKWDFSINITFDPTSGSITSLNDNIILSFSYKYLDTIFEEEINLIKVFQGEDGISGDSGYTVILSNGFHMFSGGETYATEGQNASTEINVFQGDIELNVAKLVIEFESITADITNGEVNSSIVPGLDISYNNSSQILMLVTNSSRLSKEGSLKLYITFNNVKGNTITTLESFQFKINFNGDSYNLTSTENLITYMPSTETFSPAIITLSTTYRKGGIGANLVYTTGKVFYSIDNSTSLVKLNGANGIYSMDLTSKITNSNRVIHFKLYNEQANDASPENKYLLDVENVSIVVSLEGIEIGGDNLLKWTKTFPLEQTKWIASRDDILNIDKTEDFYALNFNKSGLTTVDWSYFSSPKIPLDKEYINKQFCLSFYIKSDDWSNLDDLMVVTIIANSDLYSTTRNAYKDIGDITKDLNSSFILDKALTNGEWIKAYKVFTLNELEKTENFSGVATALEDCSYLFINFYCSKNGSFKIKKPKLELGNSPSAWSASPYDIDYNNVVGTNLAKNDSLYQTVNTTDPFIVFSDLLTKNTYYTFSFSSSAYDGSNATEFRCELRHRTTIAEDEEDEGESSSTLVDYFTFPNSSSTTQFKSFLTPNTDGHYSFRVYATTNTSVSSPKYTLTIQKAKIELGTEATPFFLNDEYINSLIQSAQDLSNSNSQQINVLLENGENITLQVNSAKDAISKLESLQSTYITKDDQSGWIEMAKQQIYADDDNYLKRLKGQITMSVEDAAEPYIQISTKNSTNFFATKITDKSLGFYENNIDTPVASISGSKLIIESAIFKQNFYIGDLLVSITDTGVGFSW